MNTNIAVGVDYLCAEHPVHDLDGIDLVHQVLGQIHLWRLSV